MRTPILSLLALSLAACGGMKAVPEDALVKVPPQRVSELAQEREDLESTQRSLATTKDRLAQAREALTAQEKQFDAALKAADREESVKLRAVQEADTEMAEDAEEQLMEAANRVADEREDVREAEDKVVRLQGEVRTLKRKVDLRQAELYEAQARAARQGGSDIDVAAYEQQTNEARKAYQQARTAADEASNGSRSDGNASAD